jgi:hypothetical protein
MHPGTMLTDAIRQWPTPTAADDDRGNDGEASREGSPSLVGAAHQWATPNVPNGGRMRQDDALHVAMKGQSGDTKRQVQLDAQARTWATPLKRDYRSGLGTQKRVGTPALNEQVTLWKTPHGFANTDQYGRTGGGGGEFHKQAMAWSTPRVACNVTGATTRLPFAEGGKTSKPSLEDQAREMWPTPAATPHGSSQNGINGIGGANERPSANTPSLDRLSRSFLPLLPISTPGDASSLSAPTLPPRSRSATKTDSDDSSTTPPGRPSRLLKARLNPAFVGWLMGFPPAWTSCGPTAMQFSLWQQRMRSACWSLVRASGEAS